MYQLQPSILLVRTLVLLLLFFIVNSGNPLSLSNYLYYLFIGLMRCSLLWLLVHYCKHSWKAPLEPAMSLNLGQTNSLFRIFNENSGKKISTFSAYMGRGYVLNPENSSQHVLQALRPLMVCITFERILATQHKVKHDPQRPYICFNTIDYLSILNTNYLWCQVSWGAHPCVGS